MKRSLQVESALAGGLAVWISTSLLPAADVMINEIMAVPFERQIHWPTAGVARIGIGAAWLDPAFDSSGWQSGAGPFGYGFDDIRTDLGREMQGLAHSLYLCLHFPVSADQAASGDPVEFVVDYDDG